MNTFVEILIIVVTSIASCFGGWLFRDRKAQKSSNAKSEQEVLQAAIESWNQMKQSFQDDINILTKQHHYDKEVISKLMAEIEDLKHTVQDLTNEVIRLKNELSQQNNRKDDKHIY